MLYYKGKSYFEAVMIDNGAAKSPSELSAFVQYCAYSDSVSKLKASNKIFRAIGKGINRSLGKATIRILIDTLLTLEFEVDTIDHDIPLIFGLENHRFKKCSSNEVELTFTHHPSNITLPLKNREESPKT